MRTASLRLSAETILFQGSRVAAQATETLGDDSGKRWLHTPNQALGGQRPLDLLDTDLGSRQVEEVLGRIEHGVYS